MKSCFREIVIINPVFLAAESAVFSSNTVAVRAAKLHRVLAILGTIRLRVAPNFLILQHCIISC